MSLVVKWRCSSDPQHDSGVAFDKCLTGRAKRRILQRGLSFGPHAPASQRSHAHANVHIHSHGLVSRQQDTPNRDGRVLWQIEMPADDKVGMDWLPCPCHVAPSAPNTEEDRWIPRHKAGWYRKTGRGRQRVMNKNDIKWI